MRILSEPHQRIVLTFVLISGLTVPAFSASKLHTVNFGKWISVPYSDDAGLPDEKLVNHKLADEKLIALKVRALVVDAHVKEFTLGTPHEITDRLFVVRRAFRLNDSLPQESGPAPHWRWQRGGWLLIDRATGRISPVNLPEFDVVYSEVTWYRDYAAYCGVSDDSKQIYAVVAQINRRKPVVKWLVEETKFSVDTQQWQLPDPPCPPPDWQRSPTRVTFEPNPVTKRTYVIRGHSVDLSTGEEDEEAAK
jgi:hypothetical protein